MSIGQGSDGSSFSERGLTLRRQAASNAFAAFLPAPNAFTQHLRRCPGRFRTIQIYPKDLPLLPQ